MNVYRSIVIEAPIDRTWAAVREFDSVGAWNPAVSAARMETGTPTSVGSVRHLDIVDGTVFRETLLAHSDVDHFYTYDIVEVPCPAPAISPPTASSRLPKATGHLASGREHSTVPGRMKRSWNRSSVISSTATG